MDLSELNDIISSETNLKLIQQGLFEMEDGAPGAKNAEELRKLMVKGKKESMLQRDHQLSAIKITSNNLIEEIKKMQNAGIANAKNIFENIIKKIEYRYSELKVQRTEDDLTKKKEALLQKREELGFGDIEAE